MKTPVTFSPVRNIDSTNKHNASRTPVTHRNQQKRDVSERPTSTVVRLLRYFGPEVLSSRGDVSATTNNMPINRLQNHSLPTPPLPLLPRLTNRIPNSHGRKNTEKKKILNTKRKQSSSLLCPGPLGDIASKIFTHSRKKKTKLQNFPRRVRAFIYSMSVGGDRHDKNHSNKTKTKNSRKMVPGQVRSRFFFFRGRGSFFLLLFFAVPGGHENVFCYFLIDFFALHCSPRAEVLLLPVYL